MATLVAAPAVPQQADIPQSFTIPTAAYDYVQREEMIPMRDGVKLHTVIILPKGAKDAPILLSRTPYSASKRSSRNDSPHMLSKLPEGDDVFVSAGYIRVVQDVRGKYGSEGEYWMTRPLRGPLNRTEVDHATDTWDTIDWLVKNVPESNGRVGMIGCSYGGFTVVMGLIDPHPALKVAAPESPMIDGWMGDDWFHYGAFRQVNLDYFAGQTTARGEGQPVARGNYDDYEAFRRAGSGGRTRGCTRSICCRGRRRSWSIPPTMLSGRSRRWTRSWPGGRRACRPCGCRACGTRRTCGARCIPTWR